MKTFFKYFTFGIILFSLLFYLYKIDRLKKNVIDLEQEKNLLLHRLQEKELLLKSKKMKLKRLKEGDIHTILNTFLKHNKKIKNSLIIEIKD